MHIPLFWPHKWEYEIILKIWKMKMKFTCVIGHLFKDSPPKKISFIAIVATNGRNLPHYVVVSLFATLTTMNWMKSVVLELSISNSIKRKLQVIVLVYSLKNSQDFYIYIFKVSLIKKTPQSQTMCSKNWNFKTKRIQLIDTSRLINHWTFGTLCKSVSHLFKIKVTGLSSISLDKGSWEKVYFHIVFFGEKTTTENIIQSRKQLLFSHNLNNNTKTENFTIPLAYESFIVVLVSEKFPFASIRLPCTEKKYK